MKLTKSTLHKAQLALAALSTVLYAVNAAFQARAGKKNLAVLWSINSGLSLAALILMIHQHQDEDDEDWDDDDWEPTGTVLDSDDDPAPVLDKA